MLMRGLGPHGEAGENPALTRNCNRGRPPAMLEKSKPLEINREGAGSRTIRKSGYPIGMQRFHLSWGEDADRNFRKSAPSRLFAFYPGWVRPNNGRG